MPPKIRELTGEPVPAEGKVLGERILPHDHADERPFTRDLHGVAVPAGVRSVSIAGRDQTYGWGGKSLEVAVPGRWTCKQWGAT